MLSVQVKYRTDKVSHHCIGAARPNGKDENTCDGCGKPVHYDPLHIDGELMGVACNYHCAHEAGWWDYLPTVAQLLGTSTVKPKQKRKSRGEKAVKEQKAPRGNCPECDGPPGARRGWRHNEGCQYNAKQRAERAGTLPPELKEGCPSCKGIPRGRGFAHTPECPLNSRVIAAQQRETERQERAQRPRATCPSCQGLAKGRGFSHTPECPLKKAAQRVPTGKRRGRRGMRLPKGAE